MKTYKKLLLLAATPLFVLLIAACGPYGVADFDDEQVMGIFAGETTFETAKKTLPWEKAVQKTKTEEIVSCGYMTRYTHTLEFPDLDMKLISQSGDLGFQQRIDESGNVVAPKLVVDRIELGPNFSGMGPNYLRMGLLMKDVEKLMGEADYKTEDQFFYNEKGMVFEFQKSLTSRKKRLHRVIIS